MKRIFLKLKKKKKIQFCHFKLKCDFNFYDFEKNPA